MTNKELIKLLLQFDGEAEIRVGASWEGLFEITGYVNVYESSDTDKLCIVLGCDYSNARNLKFIKSIEKGNNRCLK